MPRNNSNPQHPRPDIQDVGSAFPRPQSPFLKAHAGGRALTLINPGAQLDAAKIIPAAL
jgi:hypothetical protein